jgi:hypothetical protein
MRKVSTAYLSWITLQFALYDLRLAQLQWCIMKSRAGSLSVRMLSLTENRAITQELSSVASPA